jgi:hypothetical protein
MPSRRPPAKDDPSSVHNGSSISTLGTTNRAFHNTSRQNCWRRTGSRLAILSHGSEARFCFAAKFLARKKAGLWEVAVLLYALMHELRFECSQTGRTRTFSRSLAFASNVKRKSTSQAVPQTWMLVMLTNPSSSQLLLAFQRPRARATRKRSSILYQIISRLFIDGTLPALTRSS